MADDANAKKAEVKDKPGESKSEAKSGELAANTQEKSDEQKESESRQQDLRKEYRTASSASLPRLDFTLQQDGRMVARFGDKNAKAQPVTRDLKEGGQEKAADNKKDKTDGNGGKTVEASRDKSTDDAARAKEKPADASKPSDKTDDKKDGSGGDSKDASQEGKRREFKYDKGELVEVKSGFTGHTWKKVTIEGREAWQNEEGTVWRGKFIVDKNNDLHFVPDKGFAYVFTHDGKTVPEKVGAPIDAPVPQETQKAVDQVKATEEFMAVATAVRVKPDAAKTADILKKCNDEELKVIKELYKKAYGVELEDDLREKFSGHREISQAFDRLG
ncbi:MAG TPA: hypothetical protein V6D17_05025, partial [Candidatus Obscuribacterales bacterium]